MSEIKLIKELIDADLLYHQGNPVMTDTEYDILKDKVKSLYSDHPYFNTVGAPVENGNKVKLPFVLGSLDKESIDTVNNWITKKGEVVVSHKLDGVSFMVTYDNGVVVFASTRGDGEQGQDITNKLKPILPTIEMKNTISLRGELLLMNNSHVELGFKNRRNGVAGIINKDVVTLEELNHIKPVFYEILDCENIPQTEYERLLLIENLGLNVVRHYTDFEHNDINNSVLISLLLNDKSNAQYDIDGLVLTKNNSIRENTMLPSNKIAFKVNTEAIKVVVTNVEWKLGRTGRVTPLVHIEPVELEGVTISKATGFNRDFIFQNKLGIGSIVGLIRANQVIPYITEVFKEADLNIPTECPSCGEELAHIGVDIVCQNDDCYDSKVRKIAHFFKTLGSDYITETTVRNLDVISIEEMYELDELDIANIEGFGIKKAEQIYYEIQKTLKVTPDKLLAAFGINGIGRTLAPVILNKYSFDELFTITSIDNVEGIGEILSDNLVNNINDYYELYCYLKSIGLQFTTIEKINSDDINGKIFTLTGTMPMKRNEIVKMITMRGGSVKGISKSTHYLVTDDPNSGSVKNTKAQSYGTKIIDFNELLTLLK